MNRPIGIFDSGVGGLTIYKEIVKELPNETIYFFGDTKNSPYGEKSTEEIRVLTKRAIEFFINCNVKLIVLACNTATAAALNSLQSEYSIPIIGVIKSGAKTAVNTTKNNKVLLLGTSFTTNSQCYDNEIFKLNKNIKLFKKSCPTFAPFIENNDITNQETEYLVAKELNNTEFLGADTVILGCTHYPILQKFISNYYGEEVNIVSPSENTAKEVKKVLLEQELINSSNNNKNKFFISSENAHFKNNARKILEEDIEVEILNI